MALRWRTGPSRPVRLIVTPDGHLVSGDLPPVSLGRMLLEREEEEEDVAEMDTEGGQEEETGTGTGNKNTARVLRVRVGAGGVWYGPGGEVVGADVRVEKGARVHEGRAHPVSRVVFEDILRRGEGHEMRVLLG